MESIISENLNDILDDEFDNIVIFEVCDSDNTYKQISIEEFVEKYKKSQQKLRKKANIIKYNSLSINVNNSEVYKNEIKIDLSPREYKLLSLFIDNKGKVLTSEQIINCVWGVAYANAGMLRVAIKRFRSKIDPDNKYLKTIRGKGYMLIDI